MEIKKDRQKTRKTFTKKKKEFSDESIFAENPSLNENWKGLGSNKNKKPEKKTMKYIPLLQNGNKTRSGIKDLILINTCAFDAVAQVFATACADGFVISTTVFSNSTNNFCNFLKDILDNKKTKLDLYKNRPRLLENYFDKKNLKTTTEVSCHCSAKYIFVKLLIDVIYSADLVENCTHVACPLNNVERNIVFLSLDTKKTSISEAAASMLTEENNVVTVMSSQ